MNKPPENPAANTVKEPYMDSAMNLGPDKAAAGQRATRAYGLMGWGFTVYVTALLALVNVIFGIVMSANPALMESAIFGMPFNYLIMYCICFPLLLLITKRLPDAPAGTIPEKRRLKPLELLVLYPILYAVITIFSIVAAGIEQLLGSSATLTVDTIMSMGQAQWVTFVLGVIVAPIMEEIVFRRLPYRKASAYGKTAYVVWSAVIFGLFHLNLGQSLYATALGVVLALIVLRTGTIRYTIILHIMVNLTGGIGLGSIVLGSGNELLISGYSIYVLALAGVGIIIGIILLIGQIRLFKNRTPDPTALRIRTAFLNPGSISYCVFCLVLICAGIIGTMMS